MTIIEDIDTKITCLLHKDTDMTICGCPFESYADLTDENFRPGDNEHPAIRVNQVTCEDCLTIIREIKALK